MGRYGHWIVSHKFHGERGGNNGFILRLLLGSRGGRSWSTGICIITHMHTHIHTDKHTYIHTHTKKKKEKEKKRKEKKIKKGK